MMLHLVTLLRRLLCHLLTSRKLERRPRKEPSVGRRGRVTQLDSRPRLQNPLWLMLCLCCVMISALVKVICATHYVPVLTRWNQVMRFFVLEFIPWPMSWNNSKPGLLRMSPCSMLMRRSWRQLLILWVTFLLLNPNHARAPLHHPKVHWHGLRAPLAMWLSDLRLQMQEA
eukprot:4461802-Amphidinium_carterae.1